MKHNLQAGRRVYLWTLLHPVPPAISRSGRKRARWKCRCDCGTEKDVLEQSLTLALRSDDGGSRSCGCLASERSTRHGHTRRNKVSPEYAAWLAAKKRCTNPRNASYATYGGRGISMCPRWREDFGAFLRDMGPRPSTAYSLDRVDPNGDYEPGNCRWVPPLVQSRNKRGTRWYEFEGQPALLIDIANVLGISRDQARSLERRGLLPAHPRLAAPVIPDVIEPVIVDLNRVDPIQQSCAVAEATLD